MLNKYQSKMICLAKMWMRSRPS